MLCTSGFMDDVILAHKPRQLNVAAQLIEAQPTRSLGLGYKRRVAIPVAGQRYALCSVVLPFAIYLSVPVNIIAHKNPGFSYCQLKAGLAKVGFYFRFKKTKNLEKSKFRLF